MKYGGLTLGQVEAIVNKLGGMEGIQRFLAGNSEVVVKNVAPDTFRLTINYGRSLEAMIAAGRYDWQNDEITAKRFPIVGEGVVEFEARYFHFNRSISSEDAVKEIEQADKSNPWMPAQIEHVLSLGATFPDEQRKFPIIGLVRSRGSMVFAARRASAGAVPGGVSTSIGGAVTGIPITASSPFAAFSISPVAQPAGVLFCNCLRHPPSIRPTSIRCSDRGGCWDMGMRTCCDKASNLS